MTSGNLTCITHVSLGCIVAAVGFHVAGFLTRFWFAGSSGVENSLLNIREEHYIMIAEAGTNFLLCFIVLFKPIHVCVGIIAFVNMTLLLLSSFYSFIHLDDAKDDLQALFADWPKLSMSWSFYFVWVGLMVNILATGTFLTALLIKGERKASKSSKGLGPVPVQEVLIDDFVEEEKVVRVSTIASDNYGYNTEPDTKYSYHANSGTSYPGSSHEAVERGEPVDDKNEAGNRKLDLDKPDVEKTDVVTPDVVTPDDIDVPCFEDGETAEAFYIGKVNADDAENIEFGYGEFDPGVTESVDNHLGTSPENTEDDDVIETSRL